jgi:hypothetical protein
MRSLFYVLFIIVNPRCILHCIFVQFILCPFRILPVATAIETSPPSPRSLTTELRSMATQLERGRMTTRTAHATFYCPEHDYSLLTNADRYTDQIINTIIYSNGYRI